MTLAPFEKTISKYPSLLRSAIEEPIAPSVGRSVLVEYGPELAPQ
ncbi:hypothetical protein OMAG_000461 [Candidatus Omnitrophus magneticus]|uniref:Uncharacterized protein n=1 Tax=Candidatus Omnitrophus magneticus TaxID=1609969 RepID=A0A0F0CQY1_9BACT|nr:hypothetical protein OMAG_000461 [Candidatus Omnitrophus magneticus]